jgi:hypothetical protein
MAPLASVDDLEARLGHDVASAPRAEALLEDASDAVRDYTGQKFDPIDDDVVRLVPKNGKVRLPQRPVRAVSAVKDADGNPLEFKWNGRDKVTVTSSVIAAWERNGVYTGDVDVTYDHGYLDGELPSRVIGVVCQAAGRALGTPPDESGKTSETLESYSYAQGSVAAAGAVGLLPEEKRSLNSFRREGGSAPMLASS